MSAQTYRIIWCGFAVEATIDLASGEITASIDIGNGPATDAPVIEAIDPIIAEVIADFLDHASCDPAFQRGVDSGRQGELF